MRHDKARVLLDLARTLAASAEGLTLDEMAARARESRNRAVPGANSVSSPARRCEKKSAALRPKVTKNV